MIWIYIDTSQYLLKALLRQWLIANTIAVVVDTIGDLLVGDCKKLILVDVDSTPLRGSFQPGAYPWVGFGLRSEPAFVARVIGSGALGYVSLRAYPEDLEATIIAAAAGNRVLHPDVLAIVEDKNNLHQRLTPRELDVMNGLVLGQTCREIGERLGIGTKTVDTHRGHVLKKLGLRNTAELVRFAARYGHTALV